jgi:hypothetical protein
LAEALADRPDVEISGVLTGAGRYARAIRSASIGLAPRGYGGSSFRFYETAQLGKVPFLIGDVDTRPFKAAVEWEACSLYAQSAGDAVAVLDAIDRSALSKMGENARRAWRRDLRFGRWCRHVVAALEEAELSDECR